MKKDLIARVMETLQEAGFIVSSRCEARGFDLAARREEITLLAKILHNIDGINEGVARSIKRAAFCLLASPVVIGEKRGTSFLEDDVVYHRYGIPALNAHTLYDYFIGGVHPYVYSATGGLYVNIDGEEMQWARERKELSLGDVAAELGVSRRSVSKYEEGGTSTTIDIALKLEEILDTKLIEILEFLKSEFENSLPRQARDIPGARVEEVTSGLEQDILGVMEEIGFEIFRTAYAPFNAVSLPQSQRLRGEESERMKILTGISKYTGRMIKKARIISSLSRVTRTKSVLVVNGNVKRVQVDNTVLIRKEELKKIRDPEEFTCMMEERAKDY